ncbi:MAG: SIS domain-containing protein [Bacteroidales bacterium]|nr:SIS domain-containing protein [Bacteroidales bacterium]MCF8391833.1 SIS domain-containing protein [Bacteroidales bacterium]
MQDEIKSLLEKEAAAILNIPLNGGFEEAVNIIYNSVHIKGGRLIASGMGKAGQIAANIATTLSSTGTPSTFIHPAEAQHGDLGMLKQNDVLLVLSNSGKTREIIELIQLVHNLHEQIPFVLITGNPDSTLPALCDAVIFTGNPPEVCALGLTPTTSTTTMTVIGDVLVVLLMKKIKFNAADYAKRHHGGYLGDMSRKKALSDEN